MYAVILAGGKGQRFWPSSRESRPKQFLKMSGEVSMLSLTFNRLNRFVPSEKIILLTVESQIDMVKKELADLPEENFVIEPEGRNTAPALALASLLIAKRSSDEPFLTCPADHLIEKEQNFYGVVEEAARAAKQEEILITFGIPPKYPATGYGYIEAGERIGGADGREAFQVSSFHEKPDRDLAEEYISKGNFYWNSGIFLWRPSVYLKAWARYVDCGAEELSDIGKSIGRGDMRNILKDRYPALPSVSVDYGILEKADNVVVFPADLGWNDVGSWDALYDILPKDESGNVSAGDSVLLDSQGCVFYNRDGFTAGVGLEDIIVISDGGTILVCRRGDSQRVREIVELLKEKGYNELL